MALDGVAFAQWWADRYTRGLPDDVRERRRIEIASDVFEQVHAASAADDVPGAPSRGAPRAGSRPTWPGGDRRSA